MICYRLIAAHETRAVIAKLKSPGSYRLDTVHCPALEPW